MPFSLLADLVLIVHFAVVIMVVGGLGVIVIGNTVVRWPWVNRWWFRGAHGLAILTIVAQAWLDKLCPLTVLEYWLRAQASVQGGAPVSFIAYWLHRLLYVDAPLWALAMIYSGFAALVALAWWRFPPDRTSRR
ncbi:MAG: DUF2784 domain-containing protein [Burkholderiaceae bacterium]|jgi:hypothetical protein